MAGHFKRWLVRVVFTGALVLAGSVGGHAAKLQEGEDPLDFYPASMFLIKSDMEALLAKGMVWCMEPQGASCGFISVITGRDGDQFFYDVMEKWDENTILSVPVTGTLRNDGYLCETMTADFDDASLTLVSGKPVKPKRADDIRAHLVESWSDNIGQEYCYLYARTDPYSPDMLTQFVYSEGAYIDDPISFIVDDAPGALDYYSLRDF